MTSITAPGISVQELRFGVLARAIIFWFLNALFVFHWSEYVCARVFLCSFNSLSWAIEQFAAFHPRMGFIPVVDVLIPVSRGLRRFSTQRYPLDESACNL